MSVDERVAAASRTHDRLRALLLEHFAREPIDQLATALSYELTSLTATVAATEDDAINTLTALAAGQVWQVRTFGVGKPHP